MSTLSTIALIIFGTVVLGFGAAASARRGPTDGSPVPFKRLSSIGDVLHDAAEAEGRTVHIVYVHGMRADKWNAAGFFLKALAASPELKGFERKLGHREAQWRNGNGQDPILYAGKPLLPVDATWNEAWKRSSPFIVRTTFANPDKTSKFQVVVDEVNWWPLLMGLRCRALVGPDSFLSGAADDQIKLCMKDTTIEEGDPYYPWLKGDEVKAPPIGGAARANRYLKHEIMNWGLADAVIALGPMRHHLRAAMDWAAGRATSDAADERILIAESLGSFVAMDAAREKGSTRELVQQTRHLYFLANQFALLEMAHIEGIKVPSTGAANLIDGRLPESAPSPLSALDFAGTAIPRGTGMVGSPPAQIVAISDPSDALTFLVPCKPNGPKVSNIQARFSGWPFGILAFPVRAHRGGIEGRRIWKHLLARNGVSSNPSAGTLTTCPE